MYGFRSIIRYFEFIGVRNKFLVERENDIIIAKTALFFILSFWLGRLLTDRIGAFAVVPRRCEAGIASLRSFPAVRNQPGNRIVNGDSIFLRVVSDPAADFIDKIGIIVRLKWYRIIDSGDSYSFRCCSPGSLPLVILGRNPFFHRSKFHLRININRIDRLRLRLCPHAVRVILVFYRRRVHRCDRCGKFFRRSHILVCKGLLGRQIAHLDKAVKSGVNIADVGDDKLISVFFVSKEDFFIQFFSIIFCLFDFLHGWNRHLVIVCLLAFSIHQNCLRNRDFDRAGRKHHIVTGLFVSEAETYAVAEPVILRMAAGSPDIFSVLLLCSAVENRRIKIMYDFSRRLRRLLCRIRIHDMDDIFRTLIGCKCQCFTGCEWLQALYRAVSIINFADCELLRAAVNCLDHLSVRRKRKFLHDLVKAGFPFAGKTEALSVIVKIDCIGIIKSPVRKAFRIKRQNGMFVIVRCIFRAEGKQLNLVFFLIIIALRVNLRRHGYRFTVCIMQYAKRDAVTNKRRVCIRKLDFNADLRLRFYFLISFFETDRKEFLIRKRGTHVLDFAVLLPGSFFRLFFHPLEGSITRSNLPYIKLCIFRQCGVFGRSNRNLQSACLCCQWRRQIALLFFDRLCLRHIRRFLGFCHRTL